PRARPPGGPPGRSLLLVVQPGEPGRQPVDRGLELGVEVDELAEPVGEPDHADLLLTAPLDELFDPSVREVHACLSVLETAVSVLETADHARGRSSRTAAGPDLPTPPASAEDLLEELLLLRLVLVLRAGGGRRVRQAGDPAQGPAAEQVALLHHLEREVRPDAHVHGLLLRPHQLHVVAVPGELGLERPLRERVEPLDADERDVVAAQLLPARE